MPILRTSSATLILFALAIAAWLLATPSNEGRALSFSLLAGGLFGVLLQRSRFCFFCVSRDFIERRDPRGLLGILAALAVGTLGYHAAFGAFLPDPASGRLPPDAHIGPLSWVLALGATLFGLGMAISGSCISAHLYRLGEGALASVLALLGALIGFFLGFLCWNTLYLASIQEAPVIWLPAQLGYGGSLLLQLGVLGGLAHLLLRYRKGEEPGQPSSSLRQLLFGARWPTWVGGILIGTLALAAYLRVGPLGVTAELGSLSRTAANGLGWLPERLEGLDGFSGCATVVKEALLSNNGLFILGLVFAAWASALLAGDWAPRWPGVREALRNFLGGILLGLGGMLALGCTVGTLLSGIMAGAASGWLFAVFCFIGLIAGLRLRRVIG
ncbi:YeeE/YedE family protein [Pseudomonas sp. MM211]|uniref:YeeE/YedE family protein n=1 Tax=Pseudomonas sp. MM211 TaxID=2866808 RepID=UPI001CED8284|nr:YeeE/YedE family protein [Pseudomonas sp. MM211]